jgi:hypothetical protein
MHPTHGGIDSLMILMFDRIFPAHAPQPRNKEDMAGKVREAAKGGPT